MIHTVDHLIFAVADLDDGIRQLEERLGVRPVVGGHHPKGVTKNALLSLGERCYLELIALRDDIETPEERRWMLDAKDVRPLGWAVSSPGLEETKSRLDAVGLHTSDVVPGERLTPDGQRLEWSTASLTRRLPGAPFFIHWSDDTPHPASTSPEGCTLTSLTVASPEFERLGMLVEALDLDVRVILGEGPAFSVSIESPAGLVSFESSD